MIVLGLNEIELNLESHVINLDTRDSSRDYNFGHHRDFKVSFSTIRLFTLLGRFIALLSKSQKSIFQDLGKEIQKFLRWPRFYSHKL